MLRCPHLILLCLAAAVSIAGPVAIPVAAGPLPPVPTEADFVPVDPAQAALGRLLFYDKILSGNRNISCGTCHHHDHGSSDGLSLGVGEGGSGTGPARTTGTGADRIPKRIPRNAPGLWNIGARTMTVFFHDGRLSPVDTYGNGIDSPAEEWLPAGLSGPLAAQALFPMAAQFEMAGNPRENAVAGAVHDRIDAGWPIIAKRVRAIPAYGVAAVAAFDDLVDPAGMTIAHVGNALAAFMASEWQSIDSPFDAHIRGDAGALTAPQRRGMDLFYGRAGCDGCHSGPMLTDQSFHAIGLPAFGPGRTRPFDPFARDVGRMAETDRLEDAYRFRTPSLRNVALTAPYGHNGAYPTLAGIVRHHLDPRAARAAWRPETARLPDAPWLAPVDFLVTEDTREMARQDRALDIRPIALSDAEVTEIVAFLHALTGRTALQRPLGRPESVPSGLPVD